MDIESTKLITGFGVLGVAVIVQFLVLGKLWTAYQNLQERYNAKSDKYAEKLEESARETRALAAEILSRGSRGAKRE